MSEQALPTPENKIFYPALDGLRAVAVLLVFTFHYCHLPQALNWGWIGVDIFFVLSGFLITGILYDSRERAGRFRIFYVRRALRIFPLYYAVLLLTLLTVVLLHWQPTRSFWMWPAYLGNYVNFVTDRSALAQSTFAGVYSPTAALSVDHLWSLSVEEQFYLVWPFVVFAVGRRVALRNLCLALVVLAPCARALTLAVATPHAVSFGLLYLATPLRLDSLLLGGALALALRGPEAAALLRLGKPMLVALCGFFLAFEIALRAVTGEFAQAETFMLHSALTFSVTALLGAALIVCMIQRGSLLFRVGMHPTLRWLGQRSYGFYVYHLLFLGQFRAVALWLMLGHRKYLPEGTAVVALAGTLLICWFSFRFFEAHILRLKDRFAA